MHAPVDWSADVFRRLKQHGIGLLVHVPDAGLTRLLELSKPDPDIRVVTLSTEEEGVGLSLGAWLGGRRALLAMQSSGVGNCINALALPAAGSAPCLMLVTMRGEEGEGNRWQVPMGQGARPALEAMGATCFAADEPGKVGAVFDKAAELAFGERCAAAVLVAQKVIGVKRFER